MKELMLLLLLLSCLSIAAISQAEEQRNAVVDEAIEGSSEDENADEDIATPTETQAQAQKPASNTTAARATPENDIREGKLSEAFERFIPSEAISADNPVPFPVDI